MQCVVVYVLASVCMNGRNIFIHLRMPARPFVCLFVFVCVPLRRSLSLSVVGYPRTMISHFISDPPEMLYTCTVLFKTCMQTQLGPRTTNAHQDLNIQSMAHNHMLTTSSTSLHIQLHSSLQSEHRPSHNQCLQPWPQTSIAKPIRSSCVYPHSSAML